MSLAESKCVKEGYLVSPTDLSQYFPVRIGALVRKKPISFTIYLHFPLNDRLILYRGPGSMIESSLKERLDQFGIQDCFVRTSERALYEEFLKSDEPQTSVFKEWIVEKSDPNSKEIKAWEFLQNEMQTYADEENKLIALFSEPRPQHSINVACFSILFAKELGCKDAKVLRNLTLAALLFDCGLTQLSPKIIQKPLTTQSNAEKRKTRSLRKRTQKIMENLEIQFPDQIKKILFDENDEFGKIVRLADTIDRIAAGHFDGNKRPMAQAVELLLNTYGSDTNFSNIDSMVVEKLKSLILSEPLSLQVAAA